MSHNDADNFMHWLAEYVDYAIFGTLGFMSLILVAFVIERCITLSMINLNHFEHKPLLETHLTKKMTAIASIASLAPYVGLLGTVLGILVTFYELGQAEQIDAQAVMTGLALALKATAAGLVVAIPAMFFYNQLLRRIDVLIARWLAQQTN